MKAIRATTTAAGRTARAHRLSVAPSRTARTLRRLVAAAIALRARQWRRRRDLARPRDRQRPRDPAAAAQGSQDQGKDSKTKGNNGWGNGGDDGTNKGSDNGKTADLSSPDIGKGRRR